MRDDKRYVVGLWDLRGDNPVLFPATEVIFRALGPIHAIQQWLRGAKEDLRRAAVTNGYELRARRED